MGSRAVHIEMFDLATDVFYQCPAFIHCLCGNVRQIRCDQGSNFIGARHEFDALKETDQV